VTSFNLAAERLFGYRAEEIIGQSIRILIPPDRQEEEDSILTRIVAGKRVEHYETVRLHKNGSPIHVSISVSPVRDAEGRIIGAAKIARDISEHKWAEEARKGSGEYSNTRRQALRSRTLKGAFNPAIRLMPRCSAIRRMNFGH
jgi:PAS domain S-box-containing protein